MRDNAWSFCVANSGFEDISLQEVMDSIRNEFAHHPYEIIIVGNARIISDEVTVGIYSYQRGFDFVEAAEK